MLFKRNHASRTSRTAARPASLTHVFVSKVGLQERMVRTRLVGEVKIGQLVRWVGGRGFGREGQDKRAQSCKGSNPLSAHHFLQSRILR